MSNQYRQNQSERLLVALVATFLFLTAVRRLGPGPAGLTLALSPALAVVIGSVVLGEQVTAISFAGVVLVLSGFVAALGSEAQAKPEK